MLVLPDSFVAELFYAEFLTTLCASVFFVLACCKSMLLASWAYEVNVSSFVILNLVRLPRALRENHLASRTPVRTLQHASLPGSLVF